MSAVFRRNCSPSSVDKHSWDSIWVCVFFLKRLQSLLSYLRHVKPCAVTARSAPTHTASISTVERLAAKLADCSRRKQHERSNRTAAHCVHKSSWLKSGLRSFQGSVQSRSALNSLSRLYRCFRRTGPGPNTSKRQKLFLRDGTDCSPSDEILNILQFLDDGEQFRVYHPVISCCAICCHGEHLYQSQETTSRNCWVCSSLVIQLLQYVSLLRKKKKKRNIHPLKNTFFSPDCLSFWNKILSCYRNKTCIIE